MCSMCWDVWLKCDMHIQAFEVIHPSAMQFDAITSQYSFLHGRSPFIQRDHYLHTSKGITHVATGTETNIDYYNIKYRKYYNR